MPTDEIKPIVLQHARLTGDAGALTDDADLFALGMTSLTTVSVMLALEDRYEVEFPQDMLSRETFRTLATIAAALDGLLKR